MSIPDILDRIEVFFAGEDSSSCWPNGCIHGKNLEMRDISGKLIPGRHGMTRFERWQWYHIRNFTPSPWQRFTKFLKDIWM